MTDMKQIKTADIMPASATAHERAEAPLSKPLPRVVFRDAHYSELPAVARVMSLAFWDDHIFGALIHPHRDQYPLDSDLYWLRRARVNFWDYRYKFLVAVVPDERGAGSDRVVGIAQWERLGKGARTLDCAWYDPRESLPLLIGLFICLQVLRAYKGTTR